MGEKEPLNELKITGTYPVAAVVQKLREAPLANDPIPGFRPYRVSTITLESVTPEKLYPCALYVLRPHLALAQDLRESFLAQGIDPLNLTADAAQIDFEWQGQTRCTISAPIVEISVDDGGIPVLVDGLHRVMLARTLNLPEVTVIQIRNTAIPLPVLPVDWHEIRDYETTPPPHLKRRFRFESKEALLRWVGENYDRFLQGFDFPEKLSWIHSHHPRP